MSPLTPEFMLRVIKYTAAAVTQTWPCGNLLLGLNLTLNHSRRAGDLDKSLGEAVLVERLQLFRDYVSVHGHFFDFEDRTVS